jgi:hypothetical protein
VRIQRALRVFAQRKRFDRTRAAATKARAAAAAGALRAPLAPSRPSGAQNPLRGC